MAEQLNTCIMCGRQYPHCLSCTDAKKLRPWRTVADTLEHYKLYLVLNRYNNGYITKKQAKQELSEIEYCINELKPSVQEKIRLITGKTAKKAAPISLNSSFL